MTDQPISEIEHRGGWRWLGFFLALSLLPIMRPYNSSETLVSLGLILLGVFAYFNNPLQLAQRPMDSLTLMHKLSYVCGFTGAAVLICATLERWL